MVRTAVWLTSPSTSSEVKVKLKLDASTSLLNEDENFIPSKGSDDCDFLRPHLQSLFILRGLLEISDEQCAQYLESQTLNDIATGDDDHHESQSHPASWFSLCKSCAPIVRESFHVHKEIQKLSGKLQELKRKLRDLIFDSGSGRKQRILKRRLGSNLQNVCFQVREKILDQELAHRPQPDADIDTEIDNEDFNDDGNWNLDGLLDFENDDDDHHDHDDDDFLVPEVPPPKRKIQRKRSSPRSKPKRKRKKKSAALNEVKIKKSAGRPRVDPSKPRQSYNCKICPAIFKTEHSLKSHEKLHQKGGKECDLCQHLFRTQRRLDIHMKRHERFLNLKSKVRHKYHYISQKAWNSRIPFYCRFNGCHMIFSRVTKFIKHAEYYHPSEMIPVKCSEADCDKMFETEQILEMHRKWEHLLQQDDINESKLKPHNVGDGVVKVEVHADGTYETDKIVCPHCSDSAEEFPSVGERDFHIAEKHPDVLRTCPICGDYRADKFYSLLNHIQTTHLGEIPKIQCDLCCKTFNKGSGILYHQQEVHYKELGLERIWCEVCQLNFPSQQFLLRHKDQVHENLRPHCCEHCGKTFKTPYCLKRHITLHTAPRELQHYKKGPFFCQYCSYQCNVRQSLFYHMKKLHNDKFEFKCERCGQGYCTQNKLHKHAQHCKK